MKSKLLTLLCGLVFAVNGALITLLGFSLLLCARGSLKLESYDLYLGASVCGFVILASLLCVATLLVFDRVGSVADCNARDELLEELANEHKQFRLIPPQGGSGTAPPQGKGKGGIIIP